MTTTGRQPDQPKQAQTATEHRPDGDRSASAVARIQDHTKIVDGHVVYTTTNPATGEALDIVLGRLTQHRANIKTITADMIKTDRPAGLSHVFVDEILFMEPGDYRFTSRLVSGVWEHTVERIDHAVELLAAGRRSAQRFLDACDRARLGEPPADPMGRALWLRQHRNTGPQTNRHTRRGRQ